MSVVVNRVKVQGCAPAGSAIAGNPVLSGGSDGTNARALLVDSSGRLNVVGAAAAGAAVAGNPLLSGGTDGTNARSMLVDTSGRQQVVGAAASGAAVTGNPVLVAGTDGTNAQTLTMKAASTAAAASDPSTVVALSPNSATPLMAARTASGSLVNLNDTVAISLAGCSCVLVNTSGTFNMAATIEATADGSTWTQVFGYTLGGTGTLNVTVSSSGVNVWVPCGGFAQLRLRASSVVSGTMVVLLHATPGPGLTQVINPFSTSFQAQIEGQVLSGVSTGARPLPMGGRDGGNVCRPLRVDASGQGYSTLVTTGSGAVALTGATGAAIPTAAILSGVSDGTNLQGMRGDTSGRAIVVGAAADGAAVAGNPVLMAGQDGTNAQSILTDTTGRQVVVGGAADGAAASGNPVLVAGVDGSGNAQTLEQRAAHPVGTDTGLITRDIEMTGATYWATYDRIAPANNKYMATLFNTSSTRKVVIQRIWVLPQNVSAVTGVILEFEMRFITARTAGTSVTPTPLDNNDSLSAGITADHNSSAVTDSTLLGRVLTSSEEAAVVSSSPPPGAFPVNCLQYERKPGTRGIVLRQNRGLTLKNVTNSNVGTVSVLIEFTDEPA